MRSLESRSIAVQLCAIMLVSTVIACLTIGVGESAVAQGPQPSLFLPYIAKQPARTLYGKVTYAGQPVRGIRVMLFRWDSATRQSTMLTTVPTDAAGDYRFTNMPDTKITEWYGAAYQNGRNGNVDDPRYVWSCETNLLTGYTGEYWNLGDFDLADFPLISPENGATVGLPVTFRWTKRPATPSDSYYVGIYGVDGNTTRFRSYDLGYTDHLQLNGLPSANQGGEIQGTFEYGTPYAWYPWVSWPRSFCDSYDSRRIVFER